MRVPAILISPWVEKGGVIGEPDGPTETSQYEHSSIPATIKKVIASKYHHQTIIFSEQCDGS